MDVKLVLIISIGLQVNALVLAVRLIRVSGYHRAWLLVSLAVLLMVIRRLMVLDDILTGHNDSTAVLPGEVIGLAISLFMLLGIANIAPLLGAHRRTREMLERWVSERTASLIAANQALEAEIRQRRQAEDALRQAHDLLEQRVLERTAELRASEAKQRAILDSTPEGFVLLDQQYIIQAFNKRISQITHRLTGRELVEGGLMLDWILASELESFRAHVEQALSGESVVVEWQYTPAPDITQWYELSYLPVRLNGSQGDEVIGVCFSAQDITARKQAEMALRESEEKYRILLDESNDPIFSFTREGRYRYVNRAFAEGVNRPIEQIIGRTIWDVFPQDEADKRFAVLNQVFQTGEGKTFEVRVPRPDGDRYYITTTTPIKDEAGEVATVICSSKDITARKRAEDARLQAEKKYRDIFENGVIGIFQSQEGRFLDVNPAMARMFGYESPQAMLEAITDIGAQLYVNPPEQREVAQQLFNSTGPLTFEIPYRRRTGKEWIGRLNARVVRDDAGNPLYLEGFVEDITNLKQAEAALRDSKARLESIFRVAPVGIGVVSNRVLLEVNRTICTMTGYTAEELIGQSARILYPTDEDFEYVGRAKYADIARYGTGTVETRWRRKDGTILDILLSSTPLDPENLSAGVTFTALDITARKQTEAALRASTARLESIFRAAPVGIGLVSNRVLLEANETLCAMTGYTAEELIGQNVRLLYLSDEEYEQIEHVKNAQVRQFGSGAIETRWRCKDGTIRNILINSALIDPDDPSAGMSSTALDITARKQTEAALRRHDAILEAVTFAADQFLRVPLWQQSIQPVLEELGRAVEADRVYIFENETGPTGELLMTQRYEWAAPGIAPQIASPVLQQLPWQAGGFARWQETLKRGKPIYGLVRDFPPSERAILEPQDIRSIAVVPIFSGQGWWGFVGFDDCTAERSWTEMEIDALKAAASTLGAAIERQHIERALRASEATQRAILATIPDLLFRVDRQGTFLGLHITYEFPLHVPTSQVLGHTLRDILPPEVSEQAEYHLAQAFETGQVQSFEYVLNTPAGQRAFEARLIASGPDEALMIVRDITDRKQMELALQDSRERYRVISELISDYAFAYRVEPDGTLVREWTTGAGARITGLSLDELNHVDSWNALIHPADLPGVLDQTQVLLSGQPVTSEFRIITPQDEQRWLSRYMQPVWDDAQGRVVRIYGAVQDITERRRAEQQALELALEKERVAILANFVRDASHEFGNPLSVINTSLYLVAQTQDPQRRAYHLDMIYSQINHIEQLIKGMLTMARLDNPVDFLREPVNLVQVLDALHITTAERTAQKNLAVQFTVEETLPPLEGDSKYLHTALYNLLDNAITYTPAGGSINVCARSAERQIVIEFQDTGIGIPAESLELIFRRFYRADKARSHRGTGLGLPIAKKIIEAHGGRIEVESTPDVGSTFRVTLPVP